MPDWPGNEPLMRSMISWFTFLGFLGTTEYCKLALLKLWVNLCVCVMRACVHERGCGCLHVQAIFMCVMQTVGSSKMGG